MIKKFSLKNYHQKMSFFDIFVSYNIKFQISSNTTWEVRTLNYPSRVRTYFEKSVYPI